VASWPLYWCWTFPALEGHFGEIVKRTFQTAGRDYPNAKITSVPSEVRLSLLTTGPFLTMVPSLALGFPQKRADIVTLPVDVPQTKIPIGVVTLKNRTLGPAARPYVETARKIAKAQISKKPSAR
jgi:DNA-binding transcriptional LysR family regulator